MKKQFAITLIFIFFLSIVLIGVTIFGMAGKILVAATLVAYLIEPLVNALERRHFSRRLAVLIAIFIFFIAVGGLMALVIPYLIQQSTDFMISLPSIMDRLLVQLQSWGNRFHWTVPASVPELLLWAQRQMTTHLQSLFAPTWQVLQTTLSGAIGSVLWLAQMLLFPIFLYYAVLNKERWMRAIDDLIPRGYISEFQKYRLRCSEIFSAFIQGQTLDCLVLALLYAIGFSFSGLAYGIVVGVLSGLLNFIPYVGTMLGLILAAILATAYGASLGTWVGTFLTFALVLSLDGLFLQPLLVGRKVGLHIISTILLVIAGGQWGGIIGILFILPLGAFAIELLCDLITAYHQTQFYQQPIENTVTHRL